MKTTAAVCREPKKPFVFEEVELPDPGFGQLLVKIVATGLCHSDIASRDGLLGAPFPAIFGHEGAGIVHSVGPGVTKIAIGDHVVLAPMSDGTCRECQTGAPMYCAHFDALNLQTEPHGPVARLSDGKDARIGYFGQSSFAHYALANERNTVKVPPESDLTLLGPLGCGIQTGAGTVMNGLKPEPGSTIAIIGTGAVGLAALLGAVVSGCASIIAIDRVQSRLDLALSLGATAVIDTSDGRDIGSAIRAIVPHGVDYVVDAAGVPALISQVMAGMGKLATLALVAVPPTPDRQLELPWLTMLLAGQKVQGFIEGDSVPDLFIDRMIQLQRQGRFPFEKLIRVYDFADLNQAVEDTHTGVTIKAVVRMPQS